MSAIASCTPEVSNKIYSKGTTRWRLAVPLISMVQVRL
jgi:hypothetical protein